MTVQVEIRVPASSNGERLLVRPLMADGQLAGAEELLEADGKPQTFFVYEGISLGLLPLPRATPPADLALELEPEDTGTVTHDFLGRDLVGA